MVTLKNGGRDDLSIEDNRHLASFVLAGDFVENLGPLGVQLEGNTVALLVKVGEGSGHILTRQRRSALDEDLCALGLILAGAVGFQHERGVHDLLAFLDAFDAGRTAFVYDGEFEFCDTLELGFRLIELLRVEAGNLNQDAILALGSDDRFADAVLVHALADDLDCLIEQIGSDAALRLGNEADQE